ncbi:MAG: DUF3224 domain-containing protein [Chloroflexales bacterium]|nr:DUF3224 domain-containing protein [Chloroflexales bacterium]
MTQHARGTFAVQLTPQPLSHADADASLGRLAIAKQFQGDLAGTSQGEMLSARTAVEGSAGYVAIERVTGTLHGRQGSFVLQHSGTMDRGAPQLLISVVPDSGTGALVGLTGTMTLQVADGVHAYDLIYTLPDAA